VFCGALAPIADGLRRGAGAEELRRDVARLGATAVTFLIALSHPGPTVAQLDSARRHLIVAVLHGDRGISRVDVGDIDGQRWFLRAVAATTGDALLAEDSPYDALWGCRDRSGGYIGANQLGRVLAGADASRTHAA
jgi:hypothetical protein